jgi:hypothetical protein
MMNFMATILCTIATVISFSDGHPIIGSIMFVGAIVNAFFVFVEIMAESSSR